MYSSAGSHSSGSYSVGGRDPIENSCGRGRLSPPPSMTSSAAQSNNLVSTAGTSCAIEISETPDSELPGSETSANVCLPPFVRDPAQILSHQRPPTRNPQLSNLLLRSPRKQETPPWELPPLLSPLPRTREMSPGITTTARIAHSEETIPVPNSDAHLGLGDGGRTGFSQSQLRYLRRRLDSDLLDGTPTQALYAANRADLTNAHSADDFGAEPMTERSDTRTHSAYDLTSAGMTHELHTRSPELSLALAPQRFPSSPPLVPDAEVLRPGFGSDDGSGKARAQFRELVQKIDAAQAADELFGLEDMEDSDGEAPTSPSENASAKRRRCPGSPSPPEKPRPRKVSRRGKGKKALR